MLKRFNFPWFGRTGFIFYPVSLPGFIITTGALAYVVYSFIVIDSRSHSASDTLRPFIIRCLIVYVIYSVVAMATGFNDKKE